ncbi:MAG: Uma2 family endonuclease [Cyanobacteria bacterium CRU_2_1]|nr:Uma2 family endonuclease [Cyanobacteria bacterium RU_5_0]NJR57590.1 Uma2 family endonuclease [Cyanobacteria bacterium CRU_2_1]
MVQPFTTHLVPDIFYPDSDGQLMADNTKQFRWIVVIKENLELLFADRSDVFVAGDLLWYPVEGSNTIRQAPDVMVVLGRPQSDRGSYKQWEEDNIAPQVVFEILSPGNRLGTMARKLKFYKRYGIEEYYIYDPDDVDLMGWLRSEDDLDVIEDMAGWVSPRLGIRFELTPETLEIYRPDGDRFLTYIELAQLRDQERQAKEQERQAKEQERQAKEQALALAEERLSQLQEASSQLEAEQHRNERLAARLREMGINPEQV